MDSKHFRSVWSISLEEGASICCKDPSVEGLFSSELCKLSMSTSTVFKLSCSDTGLLATRMKVSSEITRIVDLLQSSVIAWNLATALGKKSRKDPRKLGLDRRLNRGDYGGYDIVINNINFLGAQKLSWLMNRGSPPCIYMRKHFIAKTRHDWLMYIFLKLSFWPNE